ncbi:hypothetical protein [Microbacterium sp. P5_E9]
MTLKDRWLAFIGRYLNPATLAAAKRGKGPFAFVRHTGRRSGKTFETPLVLAPVPEGFIAELTYGTEVNWYRNILKSGGEIGHRGGRTASPRSRTIRGRPDSAPSAAAEQ